MTFPTMKELFLVKEDVYHQHWTSNKKRYNVGMLYDYAKSVTEPEQVPLSALKRGFEGTNLDEPKWSDEFIERAHSTNMKYPILVVQDAKRRLWIADGNHRYGKAVLQGDEMIWAYVVRERDLPEEAIEPEPGPEDQNSHKKGE